MKPSELKLDHSDNETDDLISKCSHKTLAGWACDCAEHVIDLFEKDSPQDKRPREAIEACRAWINDEISMWNARKSAFPAHAAARETTSNKAASAVARACGHAVATAHVPGHAPHCADYAVKAVGYAGGDVIKERAWQYEHLLELSKKQLLDK